MKKKLNKPEPPPPSPPSQPPQMDSGETRPSRNTKIRSLHLLPPEVIEEILARLPVKSLLRLRCVSKSWRSSIDSRFFVNKRLRSSAEWKVISNDTVDDPNKHLMIDSTLVDSLNGLLCILKQNSFYLWNPTTRISIELPKLEFQSTKYGFGWDEVSDAYKVFVIVSEQDQKIGKVYTTLTNSWKTVDHGSLSVFSRYGFFFRGNFHWLTESKDRIESFDLKSEVFGTVELPFQLQGYISLMEKDGCIAVTCDNGGTRFDVWVMKEYWVKESWVKQNTAPIPLEYKYNYNYTYTLQDKGGVKFYPRKAYVQNGVKKYHYVESLVSPVFTSRQEQVPAIPIIDDQPKRQIKRKPASLNKKTRAPRQNNRRAADVEVSKESEEIVEVSISKEVVPRRQSKRIAALVEVSYKEVVPRRQGKRIAASADENKEVVSKRIAGRVQETVQEKVQKSINGEGRPKRENKRKEMEKEQDHPSVVEGRPKRQNRRMPARYRTCSCRSCCNCIS